MKEKKYEDNNPKDDKHRLWDDEKAVKEILVRAQPY